MKGGGLGDFYFGGGGGVRAVLFSILILRSSKSLVMGPA